MRKILIPSILLCLPILAFAAGIEDVNSVANKIQTWITGIGITLAVIGFSLAGYQVLFQGQTFQSVMPKIIGSIIAGSAAGIASLFFGGN